MAIIQVMVKKGLAKIEIDTDKIGGPDPDSATYQNQMLVLLAKALEEAVNTKQSGDKFKHSPKQLKEMLVAGGKQAEEAQRFQAASMAKAQENLEAIYAGTFTFGRGTTATTDASGAKLSREVTTEAMRVARSKVRDALKAAKIKISHVPASKITEHAKLLLTQHPEIIEEAKIAVAERAKKPVVMEGVDLATLVSPDLAKKVTARQAKRKAEGADAADKILSAATAAKVKPRPQPQAH